MHYSRKQFVLCNEESLFFSNTKEFLVDKSFKKVRFRNSSMGDFMFMFNMQPPSPQKKKRKEENTISFKLYSNLTPIYDKKN